MLQYPGRLLHGVQPLQPLDRRNPNDAGAKSIDASHLPEDFTLLQITPALDAGGVEQATLDMAAEVARLGRRSLVASRGGVMEGGLARAGAELIRLPVDARDPLNLVLNARRIARVVRDKGVSLLHVRSRAPAFSALIAARMTGTPLVATYHGIYSARSGLKRWYNGIMTRGDRVIANSIFTRGHIIVEHGVDASMIALVNEAVDTDYFDPDTVSPERIAAVRATWGLPEDDRRLVILMAARLTGWKGHAIAAQAFERADIGDRAVLVLTGTMDTGARGGLLASISPRARLTGPCADMPAAFLAASLVVAPSTQAESFGRTVVEAQAMGRPVLASAIGAHTETVVDGETGWLVEPGDIDAWAGALTRALASSPDVYARMGEAARERARRIYSLPAMYAATFEVYRQVLEAAA